MAKMYSGEVQIHLNTLAKALEALASVPTTVTSPGGHHFAVGTAIGCITHVRNELLRLAVNDVEVEAIPRKVTVAA